MDLVVARVARDGLRVDGPDAATFLQGQLSQDVAGLSEGRSVWSFLLQPRGKVDAWLRVTRTGEDSFILDVDGGWGPAVTTRLERFKLRTKVTIEPLDWVCLSVRGAGSESLAPVDAASISAPAGWPACEGIDLLGPAGSLVTPAGAQEIDAEALEALRITHGVPRMGAELTDATIPAEVGQWVIDASVSFTKGCYTGQELVARIDSRGGHVPRRLLGVVVEGDGQAVSVAGQSVQLDGTAVGTITSAAWSARLGQPVALALIKRGVEPPAAVAVDGRFRALLHSLPMQA